MEIRHLRYFVAVADEQNFGRAALGLFISQSTMSEQIQALETEVGGPLLVRTSRRVELTDAGRLLLPEARRLILQIDHALTLARAATAGNLGSIRIGFTGVVALSGVLRDDLDSYRRMHPGVEIELVEAAPSVLLEHLRNGVVDVAYAPPLGSAEDVAAVKRASVLPVVAVPWDHSFVGRKSLDLADLADQPLVAFATEHDAWAAGLLAEVEPSRLRSASSTLGVLALVSAGTGVAVVPSVLDCVAMPGVTYVPLRGGIAIDVVTATRSAEKAPVVKEYVSMLTDRR